MVKARHIVDRLGLQSVETRLLNLSGNDHDAIQYSGVLGHDTLHIDVPRGSNNADFKHGVAY